MHDDGSTVSMTFDTHAPPDDDQVDDLLDALASYGGVVSTGQDWPTLGVTMSVRPAALDAPAALAEGIRLVRAAAEKTNVPVTSVRWAEVMTFAEHDRSSPLTTRTSVE